MVFHLSRTAIIKLFFPMGPYHLEMLFNIHLTAQEHILFQILRTQIQQLAKGKINVIAPANAPDNLSTNSTQATAGLFVVQADEKDYFDHHFNTLGYHVEDTYMIPGPDGNDIQVYVYTQKSGKDSTIVDRTGLKSEFVDSHIGDD